MIHLLCMLFGCFSYLNRTWWGCELHGNHQAVFSLSVPPSKANGGRMTLHQGFFLSHYIQFLWVKTQLGVYTSTSIYFQVNLQFVWVDSLINSLILSVIGEYVFQSPYSLLTPDQSLWNSDIPISARFAIYIYKYIFTLHIPIPIIFPFPSYPNIISQHSHCSSQS